MMKFLIVAFHCSLVQASTINVPLLESSTIELAVFHEDAAGYITRRFQLAPSARTVFIRNRTDLTPSAIDLRLSDDRIAYTEDTFLTAYPGETPGNRDIFAIGHRSMLLRRFGSVAVIQTDSGNDELLIGQGNAPFVQHCVSDSIMEFRDVFFGEINNSVPFGITWIPFNMIATVPESVLMGMRNTLVRTGAVRVISGVYRSVFENCTNESIIDLPTFELTSDRGRLALDPSDYVRLDTIASVCEILFSIGGPQSFSINPLMIPGINVRFSRGGITRICDAL